MPDSQEDIKGIEEVPTSSKITELEKIESPPKLKKLKHDSSLQAFITDGWKGTAAPKFVSLEEIKKVCQGLQNMALAHEISVNGSFRIEKFEPENNTIEKTVKDILHQAYWDILRNELNSNPPVYDQALSLLKEIKETLIELLQPDFIPRRNSSLKDRINEVLDTELIKQQLEKGEFVFQHYAQFVIEMMSKICAPIRDDRIKELTDFTDVVETFKGIMETLQLMKLDLANYILRMMRPNIVAASIEYEKTKFKEFLQIQNNELQYTKQWLLKHFSEEKIQEFFEKPKFIKHFTEYLLTESFLDLLDFDLSTFAETLMLDQVRFIELRNAINRLIITACIILMMKPILERSKSETGSDDTNDLKENILPLLDTVNSNADIETITPNILVQVQAFIKKKQQISEKITDFQGFTDLMSVLEKSILEMHKPELPIRELMTNRIRQFLKNMIVSQSMEPTPGISPIQKELTVSAARFSLLMTYNKKVFGEYYEDIVSEAVSKNLPK